MADAAPAAAEAAYYQAIEEFFVGRRGDPLLISNADWLLIRDWRRAGIPLRVVLRGIADALDAHAHSFSREKKVGSLRYCAAEVEAARARWEHALALGAEESVDVAARLEGFARDLDAARGLGPVGRGIAARLAAEARQRAVDHAAPSGLEAWLSEREASLLAVLRQEARAEALRHIEDEVDAGLAPYSARMPAQVLRQIRGDAVARRLLELHGLPRLSLFHE